MSKYVSARAIAQANVQAQVCSALSTEADGVAALAEARTLLTSAKVAVPTVTSWINDLAPAAAATLDTLVPGSLANASALLAQATANSGATSTSARDAAVEALDVLRSSFTNADALMAAATRDVLVDLTAEFAHSHRFAGAEPERGDDVAVFDLRRRSPEGEEQIVFVKVGADGSVEREYEGTGENGCQVIDAEFTDFMRSHGVELVATTEDLHRGRRPGVRLIRDAAARDPQNPARGAVLNAEQPLAAGAPGTMTPPPLETVSWSSTPVSAQRQARRSAGAA